MDDVAIPEISLATLASWLSPGNAMDTSPTANLYPATEESTSLAAIPASSLGTTPAPSEYPTTREPTHEIAIIPTSLDTARQQIADILQSGHAPFRMSYLQYLPNRLANSDCLRDCVNYFWVQWQNFLERGKHQNNEVAQPIGQILAALKGESDAATLETLASVALLERASTLFSNGINFLWFEPHLQALRLVVLARGKTNADDKLDVALTQEIRWVFTFHWATQGFRDKVNQIPFMRLINRMADTQDHHWVDENIEEFALPAMRCIASCFDAWPTWNATIRESSTDAEFIKMLYEAESRLRVHSHYLNEIARKSRTEEPTDEPVLEFQYNFSDPGIFKVFRELLTIRLILLRIINDLEQPGAKYEENLPIYREVSIQVWRMGPYVRSLGSPAAMSFMEAFQLSWNAAVNDKERCYIKDMVCFMRNMRNSWDSDQRIEDEIKDAGSLMTGQETERIKQKRGSLIFHPIY
ncbi:unnamed protein product [Clonostachys rhizophaga]|uniref:Uncharacterized protein n=1 Tax=Clonostachys rhizophaga TaxID=160324 RepID=A0A9N9VIC1_9HYPO|nr:unnamed protein product [Clonostachys rhizophaga]